MAQPYHESLLTALEEHLLWHVHPVFFTADIQFILLGLRDNDKGVAWLRQRKHFLEEPEALTASESMINDAK